jgi:hypothetical protein
MTLFHQFAAAILLVIVTLCLQCAGIGVLINWAKRFMTRHIDQLGPIRSAALVLKLAIAIILLQGVVIVLWAGFYRLRCFPSWELAFYFSGTSYSTVGYGDVVLPAHWRLLGPLESMTGVLMCGVSISLLVAVVSRLVEAHSSRDKREHAVA